MFTIICQIYLHCNTNTTDFTIFPIPLLCRVERQLSAFRGVYTKKRTLSEWHREMCFIKIPSSIFFRLCGRGWEFVWFIRITNSSDSSSCNPPLSFLVDAISCFVTFSSFLPSDSRQCRLSTNHKKPSSQGHQRVLYLLAAGESLSQSAKR